MEFEIVWTKKSISTFEKRIEYLEKHFTKKEIFYFTKRVSDFLKIVSQNPISFKKSNKLANVHIGLISKQVSLIYRVNIQESRVELISFIDNRQNPKSNNF